MERELVLRLASVLWRLRRATIMETGLFEIQAVHLHDYRKAHHLLPGSANIMNGAFGRPDLDAQLLRPGQHDKREAAVSAENDSVPTVTFAQCLLRLANLPNFALDRLSRYETMLWRQAGRILFALDALDRRKAQERRRRPIRTSRVFEPTGELTE